MAVRPESAAVASKMAAVLQQVLERAELSKLPKPVQGKLERFLADQQSEIDGLRARHERFKVDSGESVEGEAGRTGTEVRGQRERGRPRAAPCGGGRAAQGLRGSRSSRCSGRGSGPAARVRPGGLGSGRVPPPPPRDVAVPSDERREGGRQAWA